MKHRLKPKLLSGFLLSALLAPCFLTTDPAGTGGGGAATPTVEELQAQITKLQGDLTTATGERDTYKNKADEADNAKKTNEQRLADDKTAADKRAETAEGQVKAAKLELAIVKVAGSLKITDPDDAIKLLDKDAIKFDKDGTPTNITELLTDLVKKKPYLVGPAEESTTARGGSSSAPARSRVGERPKNLAEAIEREMKGNK